ncbi:hypothetical protein [Zooshikella sp. RANM57]|uniref:hypothetical protein n=1 Tax=Zooshikella sp. RANM57 TaxID=3425863 RepID=UPI003D6EA107
MTTAAQLQIAVQTSGVTSATSELRRLTSQGQRTERATDGLSRQFTKFVAGATAAATAVAAATVALVRNSAAQVKEMQNLARVANTGFEAFQGFAYATEQVGVSAEALADISKDVQDKLGDFIATGGGEFADFFENVAPKVGLTAEALQGLSGPDALIAVKKALDDANVSASEQVFYLESIASDASLLTPLLEKNGEAFRQQAEKARELGLVLNDIDAAKLKEAAIASDEFDAALEGLANRFSAEFAPTFTEGTQRATDALTELNAMLASGQMEAYLEAIANKFSGFGKDIATTLDVLRDIFNEAFGNISVNGQKLSTFLVDAFRDLPENIRAFIQIMTVELAAFIDKSAAYGQEIMDNLQFWKKESFDLEARLKVINDARLSSLSAIIAENDASKKSYKDQIELGEDLREKFEKIKKEKASAAATDLPKINYTKPTAVVDKDAEKEASRLAKIREREFTTLQEYLKSEEEAILESYQTRLKIIEANTQGKPNERADLKGKLDQKYATEALDGFVNESDTFEAKAAKIDEEYSIRRERILSNTALTEQMRTDLELQLTSERNTQLNALENQRQQQLMQSSSELFGSLGDIAKTFVGEQSGVYKALFATSKAFSIAQSVMNISTAMGEALKLPVPANFAQMAIVASEGASIMSTIQSANFAGAFDKGGNIPAGKFGLVGEYGPELINGPVNVTSRKDTAKMLSEGGGNYTFAPVITIHVEAKDDETGQAQAKTISVEVERVLEHSMAKFIRQQQRPGGMLNRGGRY